jgi:hypothetical protein
MYHRFAACLLIFAALIVFGCSQEPSSETKLIRHYSADNSDGIVGGHMVAIDSTQFAEGGASVRIDANGPTVVPLYEVRHVDIDNARLIYRALVRSLNVEGQAYLEMWCQFGDKGEFFSRDLQTPVVGSSEWKTEETYFFLRSGETPNLVKLNLVVNGSGTVWIDDIGLYSGTLN